MSKARLEKLHQIESDLLTLITESDIDEKTESLLKSLTELVKIEGMAATNAIILKTVLFLTELKQEGDYFSNYENNTNKTVRHG